MFIPRLRLIALSALAAASALAAVSLDRSARDTAGDDNSFINQCGHKLGDHHLEAEESTGKWYLHAVCEGAEDGSAHCSELDLDTCLENSDGYLRETEGGNFSKTCDKCSLQTDAGGYSVAILCECDPIAPETTLLRIDPFITSNAGTLEYKSHKARECKA